MTTQELKEKFNSEFSYQGIGTPWPKTFEVDHETYANVIQDLLDYHKSQGRIINLSNDVLSIDIYVGPNNGILFKGIELILKR